MTPDPQTLEPGPVQDPTTWRDFREKFPLDFELVDDEERSRLIIDDEPEGENLHLELAVPGHRIEFPAQRGGKAGADDFHLELSFRMGALDPGVLTAEGPRKKIQLEDATWDLSEPVQEGPFLRFYLLRTSDEDTGPAPLRAPRTSNPDAFIAPLLLTLHHVAADPRGGARNTHVTLRYREAQIEPIDGGPIQTIEGHRVRRLEIISRLGVRDIPLRIGFATPELVVLPEPELATRGARRPIRQPDDLEALVAEVTFPEPGAPTPSAPALPAEPGPSDLLLRLLNISPRRRIVLLPGRGAGASELRIRFDSRRAERDGQRDADGDGDPFWSLHESDRIAGIDFELPGFETTVRGAVGGEQVWVLRPLHKRVLRPDEDLLIRIRNVMALGPAGNTQLHLFYEGIPGYSDGRLTIPLKKSPVWYREHNVGIGTNEPEARLSVLGGAHIGGNANPGDQNLAVQGQTLLGRWPTLSARPQIPADLALLVLAGARVEGPLRATGGINGPTVTAATDLIAGARIQVGSTFLRSGDSSKVQGDLEVTETLKVDHITGRSRDQEVEFEGRITINLDDNRTIADSVDPDPDVALAVVGKAVFGDPESADEDRVTVEIDGRLGFGDRKDFIDVLRARKSPNALPRVFERLAGLNGVIDPQQKRLVISAANQGLLVANRMPAAIWGEKLVNSQGQGFFFVNGELNARTKSFCITHPQAPDATLMHGCLEGPEHGVYYRGEARLIDGEAEIELPAYFEALTRIAGRTVQLTAKGKKPFALSASEVREGRFTAYGTEPEGAFCWEVRAERADVDRLDVEPPISEYATQTSAFERNPAPSEPLR